MALPSLARAQPIPGLYVGGQVGAKIMQQETTTLTSRLSSGDGNLMTGPGPAASLSLGYGLGNGLRAEVEGSFRYRNLNARDGSVKEDTVRWSTCCMMSSASSRRFNLTSVSVRGISGRTKIVFKLTTGIGIQREWRDQRRFCLSGDCRRFTSDRGRTKSVSDRRLPVHGSSEYSQL